MKTQKNNNLRIVAIIGIIAVAFMLFGCTSEPATAQSGGTQMAVSTSDNTGALSPDNNSKVYNNLEEFRKAKEGDKVKVDYTGRLPDGTMFDSSVGREPLEFTVGAGEMIRGFDLAIPGMKIGETKVITLEPKDAYGEYDANKVKTIDANVFGSFSKIQLGMTVTMTDGLYQYRGKIIEITDTNAKVDFNPELAGKTLIFDIKLVDIE